MAEVARAVGAARVGLPLGHQLLEMVGCGRWRTRRRVSQPGRRAAHRRTRTNTHSQGTCGGARSMCTMASSGKWPLRDIGLALVLALGFGLGLGLGL
eukprot:3809151-Prymnesium_polylepis.1